MQGKDQARPERFRDGAAAHGSSRRPGLPTGRFPIGPGRGRVAGNVSGSFRRHPDRHRGGFRKVSVALSADSGRTRREHGREAGRMTTLKDLSRHLGLSVTQVSRALNGHSDVSEATRLRVEKAAKKLKYMPNVSARRLVSGRSGMVGFVERSYPGIARDTILLETVTGLSSRFSERGMQFVLHLSPDTDGGDGRDMVPVYERLAIGGGLDGFVLTNPRRDDPRIRSLQQLGVPFVVHGRGDLDPPYPFVDIDNLGLARQLTEHLIGHGHRRIALINADEAFAFAAFRTRGYREALAAAGLPAPPKLVRQGRMTDALGMIATAQIFAARDQLPTAIICSNMLITKGVFSALEALGLSVPKDVSVVAHDDAVADVHPENFYPPLTVTRSPLSLSWDPLAETLVRAIEGTETDGLQTFLPIEFREGGSVGPAPD